MYTYTHKRTHPVDYYIAELINIEHIADNTPGFVRALRERERERSVTRSLALVLRVNKFVYIEWVMRFALFPESNYTYHPGIIREN